MKPSSEEKNAEFVETDEPLKQVNSALDRSIEQLPEQTLSDIAQARILALSQLNQQGQKPSTIELLKRWLTTPWNVVAIPIAAALLVTLSVNYLTVEVIPELPLAMIASEVPSENLAMLEELEFVIWLAENETTALL